MEKRFGKGTEEFVMFQDYWKFIQKYAEPEDNDSYWEELAKESDAICRKYNNRQFIRDLVIAFISETERIWHEKKMQ